MTVTTVFVLEQTGDDIVIVMPSEYPLPRTGDTVLLSFGKGKVTEVEHLYHEDGVRISVYISFLIRDSQLDIK